MSYLNRNYSSSSQTIDKCQKILRMFQEINHVQQNNTNSNLKYSNNTHSNSQYKPLPMSLTSTNPSYYIQKTTTSTNKKSISKKPTQTIINKSSSQSINQSASKSTFKSNSTSFHTNNQYYHQSSNNPKHNQSSAIKRQKSNSSFVSCYNKQSRLDKIMKLKIPKPNITASVNKFKANKKAIILNTSISSLNSSRLSSSSIRGNNKENIYNLNKNNHRHKESRLQKIMNIKIEKPKVNSTLINYQPQKIQRSLSRSSNNNNHNISNNNFISNNYSTNKKPFNNSVIQLKDCRKKQRKSQQVQQKQDRLWRVFQRQRQSQLKDKKKQQQQYYKQQRRQQQKFQKLVQKQLSKIENSRQISLRKQKAFSQYVYPAY